MPPMSGLPDEGEDDDRARVDGTAFGQLLHGILQRVEFNLTLRGQLDALHPLIAAEQGVPVNEADRERLGDCLERLLQLPCYDELIRATQTQRELRFLAQEGGVFVPGIIDLLACTDGQWWILDYKTGRASIDHLRQVAIYALGVRHALGVTPARVRVAYLDGENSRPLRDEPVTAAHFDEAKRIIHAAGEGIMKEDYHPAPERHCEFCPYLSACPEGREALVTVNGSLVKEEG